MTESWCFWGWWLIRAAGQLVGGYRGLFESPIKVEDEMVLLCIIIKIFWGPNVRADSTKGIEAKRAHGGQSRRVQ